MVTAIVVNPADNVATALQDLHQDDVVTDSGGRSIHVRGDIPYGHKVALLRIERGSEVIKYGEVIGRATRTIEPGEHTHVHNLESLRGRGDL